MRISQIISSIFGASLIATQAMASGVDLNLIHGSRYIYLGGHQVALGGDAYTLFYNPGAMMSLDRPTFAVNSMNLLYQYEAPIGADNAQRKSTLGYGPYFYLGAVYPINNRVTVGLAFFPTASQGGKFSDVTYGPFAGLEYSNRLFRLEVAPTVAVRLMEHLSVGLSWKIGYTQYDKKVGSFGTPAIGKLDATYLDSSVNTWDAKGAKIGAYVDNLNGLTVGLTYRFENPLTLSGTTKITNGLAPTGVDASTEQDVTLPAQLQFGIAYEWIPDTFMTAFNYDFTMNSTFVNDAPVITGLPAAATSTPLKWKDGHTFHFGAEYTFHPGAKNKIRTGAGIVYDRAVTRAANPNPVLTPANAYIGYSIGGQYEWADAHKLGLALNYGQYDKSTSAAELNPALANKVFAGKYGLTVYVVSVDYQLSY